MSEMDKTSRRGFLKRSSLLASGLAASNMAIPRNVHAASNDVLKIASIGLGSRGTGAVKDCLTANPNTKLVAVADVFEDRVRDSLKLLKEKFKERIDVSEDRIFLGFDAYQRAARSDVDIVFVTPPPAFHPMHYKAAVEAGKHVFMEKPACIDAAGFRSVMETNKTADEKNLKVTVGLDFRHAAFFRETVQRIHEGELGKLNFLRAYYNTQGWRNRPRKPGQTEMEYQVNNWLNFVWLGGGQMLDQHVHWLDVCNWIKQAYPIEAQGMGGREVRKFSPEADYGYVFDHHYVEFSYADGTKLFSQCRHLRGGADKNAVHVHGTQGEVEFRINNQIYGEKQWRRRGEYRNPYEQEHADLVDAILNDKKHNQAWQAATSSMTAVMGRMATYSGKMVHWDEAVAKGPSMMPQRLAFDADPPVLPDENGSYEHAVAVPGVTKPY